MISSIVVLYDAACPTCVRARAWLERQHQLLPIEFVAAGSPEARRRFPLLDHERTLRDVTAIGDDGSVYRKDRAWVVLLWATVRWRGLAESMASPVRRPLVKVAAGTVNRWRLLRKRTLYRDEHAPWLAELPPPILRGKLDAEGGEGALCDTAGACAIE